QFGESGDQGCRRCAFAPGEACNFRLQLTVRETGWVHGAHLIPRPGSVEIREALPRPLAVRRPRRSSLHARPRRVRSRLRSCYIGTMVTTSHRPSRLVERVQTGVRMEKRLLKGLKALAALHALP